jgi:hypothetical protein
VFLLFPSSELVSLSTNFGRMSGCITRLSGCPIAEMLMPVHTQNTCRYVNASGWSDQTHLLISLIQWNNSVQEETSQLRQYLYIIRLVLLQLPALNCSHSLRVVGLFTLVQPNSVPTFMHVHTLFTYRFMSVFENRVPRRIFGYKSEKGGSRKVHNAKLNNL